jgi:hypothetical protein
MAEYYERLADGREAALAGNQATHETTEVSSS